jgi:uncharacterized HAD superfamily protein
MTKAIVAIDIDDVLVPHYQDLIDWYNEKYGTQLTMASNGNLDPTPWGTDVAEIAIKRVHGYFETETFRNEQPFPAAISAVKQLSEYRELVAITARDNMLKTFTEDWVSQYFGDTISTVRFTAKYSLEAKAESKTDVCLELGVQYLIDDSLSTAIKLSRAGVKVVLFGDYPWNQAEEVPANVTRCRNWAAVTEYFDGQR